MGTSNSTTVAMSRGGAFVTAIAMAVAIVPGSPFQEKLWSRERGPEAVQTVGDLGEPDRIDALIRGLGASEFHAREQAEQRLRAMGLRAFDPLRKAQDNEDVEIRLRVRYLIDEMRGRGITQGSSPGLALVLKDYADQTLLERSRTIARLRRLAPQDGVPELIRLVRFEAEESLAQDAALAVMAKTGDRPSPEIFAVKREILAQISE